MAKSAEMYNLPAKKLNGSKIRKHAVKWMHAYSKAVEPTTPSPQEKIRPDVELYTL
jgi:hypothetical protein